MSYEQIVNLVSQVGFPILVAAYLLLRMETILKKQGELLERLVQKMEAALERAKR